jgi:hypothetical protein
VSKASKTTACGTGRPLQNRPSLDTTGVKDVPPRLFWALAGSGLSLRRGSNGWRADCPCDPSHTLSIGYHNIAGREDAVVYLRCWPQTNGGYEGDGCQTLAVLRAFGCTWRDLYHQTGAAADGRCDFCGSLGYRVDGLARQRPVCLAHLLDHTKQPRALLFAETK